MYGVRRIIGSMGCSGKLVEHERVEVFHIFQDFSPLVSQACAQQRAV